MRTSGVKTLVNAVLATVPKPHTEHVIDDVFHAIEHHEGWRREYDDLCAGLGKTVVNTWGGYWIANALEKSGLQQVPSVKSTLIGSYSKLDAAAVAAGAKRKEPAALELMAAYYRAHKDELPKRVRQHRELIVELLMAGLPAEQAFASVPADGA